MLDDDVAAGLRLRGQASRQADRLETRGVRSRWTKMSVCESSRRCNSKCPQDARGWVCCAGRLEDKRLGLACARHVLQVPNPTSRLSRGTEAQRGGARGGSQQQTSSPLCLGSHCAPVSSPSVSPGHAMPDQTSGSLSDNNSVCRVDSRLWTSTSRSVCPQPKAWRHHRHNNAADITGRRHPQTGQPHVIGQQGCSRTCL